MSSPITPLEATLVAATGADREPTSLSRRLLEALECRPRSRMGEHADPGPPGHPQHDPVDDLDELYVSSSVSAGRHFETATSHVLAGGGHLQVRDSGRQRIARRDAPPPSIDASPIRRVDRGCHASSEVMQQATTASSRAITPVTRAVRLTAMPLSSPAASSSVPGVANLGPGSVAPGARTLAGQAMHAITGDISLDGANAAGDDPGATSADVASDPAKPNGRPTRDPTMAVPAMQGAAEGRVDVAETTAPMPSPSASVLRAMPPPPLPSQRSSVSLSFTTHGPGHVVTATWTPSLSGTGVASPLIVHASSEASQRAVSDALAAGLMPAGGQWQIETGHDAGDRPTAYPSQDDEREDEE